MYYFSTRNRLVKVILNKLLKLIIRFIVFTLFTILTQVGGLVYITSLLVSKNSKVFKNSKLKIFVIFGVLYLNTSFLLVPYIAPMFGREPVKHSHNIKATSFLTIILNRNYVTPDINNLLKKIATQLKETGIEIRYLDANFPFIDGFPLLPHLSHNDGKKLI